MRQRPNDRIVLMVSVALGESPQEELGRLTPRESARLEQLKRLVLDLQGPLYAAPETVLNAAKAIFEVIQPVPMRVLSSSLSASGTRIAAENLQEMLEANDERARAMTVHAVFEMGDETARAMYVRFPDGWRVIGQAPSSGWVVLSGDSDADCDVDGRFEMVVVSEMIPEITLTKDGRSLVLPSPSAGQ